MGAGRPKLIDDAKVFDVAKPARSKPMGTSRSVIASHKASVKDDTMVDKPTITEKPEPLLPPSANRRVISPISEEEEIVGPKPTKSSITVLPEEKPAEESMTTAPVVVSSDSTEKEEAEISQTETEQEILINNEPDEIEDTETTAITENEKTETEPTEERPKETDSTKELLNPSDLTNPDDMAAESEKPKNDQQMSEEEIKKESALQELIDSKKYFVPLAHDSSKQKSRSGVWAVLLLFLVMMAGAYLAVDAKIIKTNIKLPYHLFNQ